MRILWIALPLALVACASPPSGADPAKWQADRTDCIHIAEAQTDAESHPINAAGVFGAALGGAVGGAIIGESESNGPRAAAQSWLRHFRVCMAARGYPNAE